MTNDVEFATPKFADLICSVRRVTCSDFQRGAIRTPRKTKKASLRSCPKVPTRCQNRPDDEDGATNDTKPSGVVSWWKFVVENERFATLSVPSRFIVLAIVGAFGGAGFTGLVSKFGAYWYVWYYRLRVPADGLSFVTEIAAIQSFLLLIALAFVTVVLGLAFNYVANLLNVLVEFRRASGLVESFQAIWTFGEPDETFREAREILRGHRNYPLYLLGVFGGGPVFVAAIFWAAETLQGYVPGSPPSVEPKAVQIVVLVVIIYSVFGRALISTRTYLIGVAVVFSLATFSLWIPSVYASYLAFLRYGGGIPIEVTSHNDHEVFCYEGELAIRTDQALILWVDDEPRTVEIPLSRVDQITYPDPR